ncbi:MAG: D-aminoacyl-tRNA deacylase [Chloroflexota bacterium]|nr:D-aminoacyl-tRNA deacylase [Chloroflexota bacterium]
MRALIQRVSQASVDVGESTVASIGEGLVVLVGIGRDDSDDDVTYLAEKIPHLRIFSDEAGLFNRSVLDIAGELLIVSQFTLYASTRKGRRPGFTDAAPPEEAEPLVERLVHHLRATGLHVETGRFQQHMMVKIYNDGPVTIFVDSEERLKPRR